MGLVPFQALTQSLLHCGFIKRSCCNVLYIVSFGFILHCCILLLAKYVRTWGLLFLQEDEVLDATRRCSWRQIVSFVVLGDYVCESFCQIDIQVFQIRMVAEIKTWGTFMCGTDGTECVIFFDWWGPASTAGSPIGRFWIGARGSLCTGRKERIQWAYGKPMGMEYMQYSGGHSLRTPFGKRISDILQVELF